MNSVSYPEKALPMTPSTSLVSCISAEVFSKKREIHFLPCLLEVADYFPEPVTPVFSMENRGP